MKLALDIYGTHVLERMIMSFDNDLIQPISMFILDHFLFLSNNQNDLCLVKKPIIRENNQKKTIPKT